MATKNCKHCGAELFWVTGPDGESLCLDKKRESRYILRDVAGRLTAKKVTSYSAHTFTCQVMGKRAKGTEA